MSIINLNTNYYYEDFIRDSKELEEKYYPLLKKEVIGLSYDNRDIVMLKVGMGKKNIFCVGSVHGRESINLIVLMKIIETYLEGYINHNSIKYFQIYQLLQTFSIYFIPLLNPDGYMISLKGFGIIKNEKLKIYNRSLKIPYYEWKYNGRGVDLNRNFPSVTWRAKNEKDYSGSENETKALITVLKQIPSIGFIDYHSRGKSIYYYRKAMLSDYNSKQKEIAMELSKLTRYQLVPENDEIESNDSGGNTVHFYSEYIGGPAITIETVSEEQEFPLNIINQIETFSEIVATPIGLGYFLTDIYSPKSIEKIESR